MIRKKQAHNRVVKTDWERLSAKQRVFVEQYIHTWDSASAARAAGYANPTSTGVNLLDREGPVRRIIASIKARHEKRFELTAENIMREISYLSFRDPADLCDEKGQVDISNLRKLPEHARRAIDGIKQRVVRRVDEDGEVTETVYTEVKMVPKAQALGMAVAIAGLKAPDKQEIKVTQVDWDGLVGKPSKGEVEVIDDDFIQKAEREAPRKPPPKRKR